MDKLPPLVSAIVTTKNEEKNIGRGPDDIKNYVIRGGKYILGHLKDFAKTRTSKDHSLTSTIN